MCSKSYLNQRIDSKLFVISHELNLKVMLKNLKLFYAERNVYSVTQLINLHLKVYWTCSDEFSKSGKVFCAIPLQL